MLTDIQASVLEFRRGLYRPVARKTVVEWAEENLKLSSRQTEHPGPLSTSTRPYMREPMEAWKDSGVSEVVLCWGSQTAKTTTLMAGAAWMLCEDPSPTMWLMPTENLARSFSKTRWMTMLEDSPRVVQEFPGNRHQMTNLEQHFKRCTVNFIGSNSPANLASRPVRVLIADEVDKFADATSTEADALHLAEQRLKAFSSSKAFLTSTPTVVEGPIWQRFLQGDQRRFYIPCPNCRTPIKLLWPRVRWDEGAKLSDGSWDLERVSASARYECQECQQPINDAQKVRALRDGEWRPENPGAMPGCRSYHLSSLYSPDRKCTWGSLAAQFLKEKHSLLGLQGFINGSLAEPWENQDDSSSRVELVSSPDDPPLQDSVVIISADHQALAPYFWVVAREWDKAGNSRLRGCYTCDDWDALRRIQLAIGADDKHVTIDSRHNPDSVRENCLRFGRVVPVGPGASIHVGWTPWDGQNEKWRIIHKRTGRALAAGLSQHPVPLTRRIPYNLHSLMFSGDFFLSLLARMRKGPGQCGGVRWEVGEFPVGPEVEGAIRVNAETYWRHMDAKKYTPRVSGKRVIWGWQLRSGRWPDHILDAEISQLAMASFYGRLPLAQQDDKQNEK